MAIVRNPANTVRRGRVGETTYYVSGGQQIARQARNSSNYGVEARRSEAQQSRRVLWANLVNFYKASASWMAKAFETRKRNQTDYNKFMAVNIANARIALTRDEAAAGACVVDEFIVSQGSMAPIEITAATNYWRTNIALGNLQITDATTVAELSAAMIANNAHIQEGMQLSFVSYQQTQDSLGTPRVICRLYEMVINPSDSRPVRAFLPSFAAVAKDSVLATGTNISVGGFAYILSKTVNGQLRVSTQQLVANNQLLISTFSSPEHVAIAIKSYGLDKEVVLSPIDAETQQAEGQPNYIQYLEVGGKRYAPGSYFGSYAKLAGQSFRLVMANNIGSNVDELAVYSNNEEFRLGKSVAQTGKFIDGTFDTVELSGLLSYIEVELNNSTTYVIQFAIGEGPGGDL